MLPSYTAVFSPIPLDGTVARPVVAFTVTATAVAAEAGDATTAGSATAPITVRLTVRVVLRSRRKAILLKDTRVLLAREGLRARVASIGQLSA